MNNWSLALLPLLGVLTGAVLQFWFGRKLEKKRVLRAQRVSAYADYFKGFSAAHHATKENDRRSALRDIADAKARILVYGEKSVIQAIASFEKQGSQTIDAKGQEGLVNIVASMREASTPIDESDIRLLLFADIS